MVKLMGRAAGSIAAAAIATGATLMFAPTAHAGTTTGTAECTLPASIRSFFENKEKLSGPQPYTVTGPATAAAGSEVELDIDLGPSPASSPLAVPNAKMTPTLEFKTAGASTAPITAKASTITMNLAAGPMDLPAFKLKIKIPAGVTGKLDLTPAKLTLDVNAGLELNIPCAVSGAGVVHSINVTAASGTTGTTTSGSTAGNTTGTTTGTTTAGASGTTSSGSTGSLPKTGPLDDAMSMGLVGGTVGLLGIGAVLIATRKVRAARNNTA